MRFWGKGKHRFAVSSTVPLWASANNTWNYWQYLSSDVEENRTKAANSTSGGGSVQDSKDMSPGGDPDQQQVWRAFRVLGNMLLPLNSESQSSRGQGKTRQQAGGEQVSLDYFHSPCSFFRTSWQTLISPLHFLLSLPNMKYWHLSGFRWLFRWLAMCVYNKCVYVCIYTLTHTSYLLSLCDSQHTQITTKSWEFINTFWHCILFFLPSKLPHFIDEDVGAQSSWKNHQRSPS